MRKSIGRRLTLVFVGLATIPLLIVGVVLARLSFSTQQEQAVALQRELAQRVAAQEALFFSQRERELEVVSSTQGLTTLPREEQTSILFELQTYGDDYETLALLDPNGQELAGVSRVRTFTESDLRDRSTDPEFTTPISTGKPYYSPVWFEPLVQEPLITVSLPLVDDPSGTPQGVLVADIRIKPVWALIAGLDISEGQMVYIVDGANRVIAHNNPSFVLSGATFEPPVEDGIFSGLEDTQAVLATYHIRLGEQELRVVTERPARQALALAINTVAITTGVIVAALLAATVAGIVSVRRIVDPILQLVDVANSMREGNLNRRVEVKSQDEIGQLGRAFNEMSAQLNDNIIALEQSVKEANAATALAREATRLKDEFLSVMSHELRTPLNAIMGYQGLLELIGGLDDEATEMVQRTQANARRLLSLINDVLDISRIEAGRMEITPVEVNVQDIVDQVRSQLEVLATEKNLAFNVSLDKSMPATVFADEDAITKILVNLLTNAFKFTEEGSVNLRMAAENGKMTISVSDTGVGIPTYMHEIIFERFRQVDSSSTRKHGGSGLGLTIVQQLCQLMGGTVTVESDVGRGSTFTVKLPLQPITIKERLAR